MPEGTTVSLKLLIQAVDKASKTVASLEGRLNEVSKAAEKLSESSEKSGRAGVKSMQNMDKQAKATKSSMDSLADSILKVGGKLTALGASIAAPFALAIKSSADFEKAFARVLAVTSGAQENFQELKNTAAELGRTTKFTATEAAEGMAFLGQAGFDAKEVIAGIGPSIVLARVAAVDLATAADLATNVLSGMRLGVEDLGIAIDVLANTAAKSNTNLLDMAEAISYSGPVAAAVGVDIQQLASLVGVLGNAGIKGSRAGTALRQAMFRLANPSAEAEKIYKELGVTITTTADGSLDLIDVLNQLSEAQLTAADANKIFGRFASAGVLAITSQREELGKLVQSNYAAAGSGEEMAKIMGATFRGALIKLTSALDGLRRTIGDKLIPVFTSITKGFTAIIGAITDLIEKFPVLTGIIVKVVAVFGTLLTAAGAATLAIGGFVKALAVISSLNMVKTLTSVATGILRTGTAAQASTAKISLFSGALATLNSNFKYNLLYFGKFKAGLMTLKDVIVGVGAKLKGLVLAHPFIAAAAAIGIAVVALFEWDKRLDKAIAGARKSATELAGLNNSFEKQLDNLEKLKEGSDEYTASTKNLEKQLIKIAEENDELSLAALNAANSIDDVTGEVEEGSTALRDFAQAARELELEKLTLQVELLETRWKRMNGEGGVLSSTLEGLKKTTRGVAYSFVDLFSVMSGGEGGKLAEALQKDIEESEKLEKHMEQAAQAALSRFAAYEEIDMSASTEEMEVFFSSVLGLSGKAKTAFTTQFAEMQASAEKTAKDVRSIENASTGELTIQVEKQVKVVKELGEAYTEAARRSEEAAKIAEQTGDAGAAKEALAARIQANKERLAAEKDFNNQVEALRKQSEEELKVGYDDELRDLKRAKDLEYIEEWDFIQKKSDLDERYANERVNNLRSIIDQAKRSGASELSIYDSLSKELTRLDKEAVRRSEDKRDAQILHANQIKDAVDEIRRSTEDITLELSGDFNAQQGAKLAQEIADLEKNAAKIGLQDREVIEAAKSAITKKYARQASEYQEKLRQIDADRTISLAQATADRQVENLERAFERGEISPDDYVNQATSAQTTAINLEIDELQNRLDFIRRTTNDQPAILKLEADLDELSLEKTFLEVDKARLIAEARGQKILSDLQKEASSIQSQQFTTPDNLANIDEQNELALQAMRNKHAQEIQEMSNHGATQLEIVDRINEQILERNKVAADLAESAWEARMGWGQEMAGTLSQAFGQMYEVTGKKAKEFFYLQKAAALAEATMSIAQGVAKAWGQGGMYGAIGAAIVATAGAVQLATIASQGLAEGGKVGGTSPNKKADNIPAWLTANEWVHPVDTVKYYGEEVMEAMRKRIIPKEVFSGFKVPVPRYFHSGGPVRLAEGGMASGGSSTSTPSAAPQQQQKIDIVNVVDENMMQKYIASNSGKEALFNVIRSNSYELKNALSTEM